MTGHQIHASENLLGVKIDNKITFEKRRGIAQKNFIKKSMY